ncbi:MAG: S-adenosylmethionine:tRNA ribosyltransferase-isomerase, partial [Leadbetterella sp.]
MSEFDYFLPEERIAQYPSEFRDSSKLLIRKKGHISNTNFSSISEVLPPDSLLVFNDTKVIPARIQFFKPSGAKIEIFLLEPFGVNKEFNQVFQSNETCTWRCLIGNKKKVKQSESLIFPIGGYSLYAEIIDYNQNLVKFSWDSSESFADVILEVGKIPLPPYMNREATSVDIDRYQTIFAKHQGAVAAPTAALHFTPEIIENLKTKGHTVSHITLHVG